MKANMLRMFGFIAVLTTIGLLFVVCDNNIASENDNNVICEDSYLTGTVRLSGNFIVGEILTADTEHLSGNGTVFYKWNRADEVDVVGTIIINENQETYKLTVSDIGKHITVTVTRDGYSGSVTSGQRRAVANCLNWRSVTNSTFGNSDINSVAYGGYGSKVRYIAVGNEGKMAISINGGLIWNAVVNSSFGITNIKSIAWGGDDRWVAVGNEGMIAISTDGGETWNQVIDSTFETKTINCVAWGNSRWIAVGNDGKMATSMDDGESWNAIIDNPFGTSNINGVVCLGAPWALGRWGAVGDDGKAAYSHDGGKTWYDCGFEQFGMSNINGVAFSNPIPGNKTNSTYDYYSITYGNDGKISKSKYALIEERPLGTSNVNSMSYWNGYWIAVGDNGKTAYSENGGINWYNIGGDNPFGINSINSVNRGVAVGSGGKIMYYSRLLIYY